MLRTVFVIRHAKSDQHSASNDLERPLNQRGMHDAPVMAKRLKEKQPHIDAFVTSPATRTKTTAGFFAAEYNVAADDVIIAPALYLASAAVISGVVEKLDDGVQQVAIFAHNPGVTEFADIAGTHIKVDNMPTCGIFAFTVAIDSWKQFAKAKKDFLFFDYPKLHG